MLTTRTTIESAWKFRECPQEGNLASLQIPWLPAQVPGHVHLDLVRAGVIPDPFARMQEIGASWVDERDWVYETTFHIDGPCSHPKLVFNGLDTIAQIELNGSEIGRSDNMFIPHEFAVDRVLKTGPDESGDNTLRVTFRSAKAVGRERKLKWDAGPDGVKPHWDIWSERAMVRKAQYMYGWDWGPVLISCGIWKSVELVATPVARLTDWKYEFERDASGHAVVSISVDIERTDERTPLLLTATLADSAGARFESSPVNVPSFDGRSEVTVGVVIEDAKLWQPAGVCGVAGPERYELELKLVSGTTAIDDLHAKIGLRTVELVREADPDGNGESFKFRVNGRDLFAKGANWIPNDSFPSRITADSLRERIGQAHDAGFNMLRIWGGGLYESEEFYEICDSLGITVWQDFPYACSYYPDTGEYATAARAEATAAARRIRNHPSLVLWCGNNENRTMFESKWMGIQPPRYLGEHLYDRVLPQVVAAECPSIPYWPSSPYGGPDANSEDFGDCHNWDVWHGRGDWVHYTENDTRFCSEFGFASSCGLAAWDAVLAQQDRRPRSPAVMWHDKTRKGYETYLGYIDLHYPPIRSLEDLVYYSQINQAEALKYGIEHYRRRKGRCWGTLFWQLNDCWPVQSWAVIDSLGEPKAAYYASKSFYAPVLLSLLRKPTSIEVHLVSDLDRDLAGQVAVSLRAFDGRVLAEERFPARVAANSAAHIRDWSIAALAGKEKHSYVVGEFVPETGSSAKAIALLAEPKELEIGNPQLTVTVSQTGGRPAITVGADGFAAYVWLSRADHRQLRLEDNFFHLQPGELRTVRVLESADVDAAELTDVLVARTLQPTRSD